jgi:hypothetical protein
MLRAYQSLKHARTCYRHLAGELGVTLLRSLLARGRVVPAENGYEITRAGKSWLESIGVDARRRCAASGTPIRVSTGRNGASTWAGRLASALLEHFMTQRWLVRVGDTRALRVTPEGKRRLPAIL